MKKKIVVSIFLLVFITAVYASFRISRESEIRPTDSPIYQSSDYHQIELLMLRVVAALEEGNNSALHSLFQEGVTPHDLEMLQALDARHDLMSLTASQARSRFQTTPSMSLDSGKIHIHEWADDCDWHVFIELRKVEGNWQLVDVGKYATARC